MRNKLLLIPLIIFLLFYGCTTQKNTLLTRSYHNLTAHYNVYFNGKMALQEAVNMLNSKCQYNYYDILPLFAYECPNAKNLVLSKINRTLEKAAKTITNHSITVKPKYNNLRNLTPAQLAFYKKKEYVKWIDDSYLLIAIANVYKGELFKSQQALHKILSTYKGANTIPYAKIWLARTYILQGRYEDALTMLNSFSKEKKIKKRIKKEIELTYSDLFIHEKDYKKAIPHLEQAIKLEHNRALKAKYAFILAQLYLQTGNKSLAAKYFKKVIRYNPTYDLTFHARLFEVTALGPKNNPDAVKKQLIKMLKDEKNSDYIDKIYYTLAQLDLKTGDTLSAINNFKQSIFFSKSQTQKGLTYLTLADLFFKQHKYVEAGKYYDSTLQVLPQDYIDYQKIKIKSKSLIQLAHNLEIVSLQDSLLHLASLPKNQLNKIIDSIIQSVKAKQELAQQNYTASFDPLDPASVRYASGMSTQQSQGGKWYFYNPVLISRGKQLFRQRWGDRKLEDNWRRKVKRAIYDMNLASQSDSASSKPTDLTSRQYYLNQIPLSDSAKLVSKQKIINALFNAGLIYENQLQDYEKAIETFESLIKKYPGNKFTLDAYYHLYLLYKKKNNIVSANIYKEKIIKEYPNSLYAKALKNPYYLDKLRKDQNLAENLLMNTIELYNKGKYQQVIDSVNFALKKYASQPIIPNMLFLKAKAYAAFNQDDSLINILKYIVKNYPNSNVSHNVSDLLHQLTQGKLNIKIYKFEPQTKHYFVLVVDTISKVNQKKFLLFKLANQYSNNKVFNTEINQIGKQKIIVLKTFDNLNEAKNFVSYFQNNWNYKNTWFLISVHNYTTLLKDKDLLKYFLFYAKYYNMNIPNF